MDRFIVRNAHGLLSAVLNLKSNMDRFIAEVLILIQNSLKRFKIQYG